MADNQDPLAALQQLLKDQKQPRDNSNVAPSSEEAAAVSEKETAENEAVLAEQLVALEENKQAADQIKIAEELNKMQTEIKETPGYQNMLAQRQTSAAEKKVKDLEERSKQIIQLKYLDP
jgi:hypothetical protein